jgi:2-polyprenyl-6-hydroxyphenyl methylase/3-demethylubiquinone-9 3-methyltransferase
MINNSKQKPNVNIDEVEIARFEAVASIWWDRQGDFKALQLRLNYVNQCAPLAGKSVLDVGCGGGIFSEAMASLGAVVTGIDMGGDALGVARLHSSESGLPLVYQKATAEQFAKTHRNRFDVVTCLELLEHVPDPASVVGACKTLVRPGGDVFFATINRNLKAFLFAVIGAEYILGLVRKGTGSDRAALQPDFKKILDGREHACELSDAFQQNLISFISAVRFAKRFFFDCTLELCLYGRRTARLKQPLSYRLNPPEGFRMRVPQSRPEAIPLRPLFRRPNLETGFSQRFSFILELLKMLPVE